jgi:hypothetical protein
MKTNNQTPSCRCELFPTPQIPNSNLRLATSSPRSPALRTNLNIYVGASCRSYIFTHTHSHLPLKNLSSPLDPLNSLWVLRSPIPPLHRGIGGMGDLRTCEAFGQVNRTVPPMQKDSSILIFGWFSDSRTQFIIVQRCQHNRPDPNKISCCQELISQK